MNSRLNRITDLAAQARNAGYHVAKLATALQVDRRQLARYIAWKFQVSLKIWLGRLKMGQAGLDLQAGQMVKEASGGAGYKNASDFAHAFRKACGLSPTEFLAQSFAGSVSVKPLCP